MARLLRLHFVILLVFGAAIAMLVPAAYASVTNEHEIARSFFYSSLIVMTLSGMVGLVTSDKPHAMNARNTLLSGLAVYVFLPFVLALPFAESLPDTGIFNAWWEMVSSLTTTGASLYSADLLPKPLHLWRSIVGWMGGFFILVAAVAILAPLRVGGFEILSSPYGRNEQFQKLPRSADMSHIPSHMSSPEFHTALADPVYRLYRYARIVFPVYGGLTVVLWIVLMLLNDEPLLAFCRALGTVSTSGITPVTGTESTGSGFFGELAVFVFLIPALSRRFWPGGGALKATEKISDDPEIWLAAQIVLLVATLLFLRHYLTALNVDASTSEDMTQFGVSLRAFWGGLFNSLSFLTTTGWHSEHWESAQAWSGLGAPGVILAGLVIFGGGVATTAGGVKLLRIYALARHVEREMERIVQPSSVGGGGRMARRLRREGAYLAFIFFMLFAMSIAFVTMVISIQQLEFETAAILAIAALTNAGPLATAIPLTPAFEGTAGIASAPWEGWSGLAVWTKCVLAGAMVVGRLETLAILALFTPEFWRR